MTKLLVVAAFLYVLIAPFTYHPDTKLTLFYASLNNQRVFDIYTYLHTHTLSVPHFYYPPMHFWLLKIQYFLARPLAGNGFDHWLAADSRIAVSDSLIYRYNFAAKWPLLVLALATGYFLYLLVKNSSKNETKALLSAAFWLFNPLTLYAVVMMGQNDILAIFFFILGWYLYTSKPRFWGLFCMGIAGAVKNYPLFWTIYLIFLTPQKTVQKILHLAIPFVIFFLTIAPFINFPYFRQDVFQSGLSSRMFVSTIDLGFGDHLNIVPLLLIILFFTSLYKKPTFQNQSFAILTANLIILGFSHFHPQWFLWLVPFLAICFSSVGQPIYLFLLFAAWLIVTLLFDDKYLYWGIISPLNPSLFNLPTFRQFLTSKIDIEMINNLAHALIAAISLIFLFIKIKKAPFSPPSFSHDRFAKLALTATFFIGATLIINLPLLKTFYLESDINYSPFSSAATVITGQANGLTRLEIAFNNPNLIDRNKYKVSLLASNNTPIFSQNFNGFNLGSPSHLRLDFPAQNKSLNQRYLLTVSSINQKNNPLEIGMSQRSIARIEYYQPSLNPLNLIKQTFSFFVHATTSNPLWLLILIALFLI